MRSAFSIVLTVFLASQQAEPLRVNVRLVEISVVAVDKTGQPVTDLTKDDFEVWDNDKPQDLRYFTLETRSQPVVVRVSGGEDVYSNRQSGAVANASGFSILLFDLLNTEFADQENVRKQMMNALRRMKPGERIGIYLLGRTVSVLHDFTDDPAQLAAVLAKFEGRVSPQLAGSGGDAQERPADLSAMRGRFDEAERLVNGAKNVQKDYFNVDRATVTLKALEGIAKHLARQPGRKTIVWISGSFPFTLGVAQKDLDNLAKDTPNRERGSFQRLFDSAMRAVSDADIAIYPVDARGLAVGPGFDAESPSGSEAGYSRKDEQSSSLYTPANRDTMENLAAKSGGRVFFNTNDIESAIGKALADGKVTYTLGFSPTAAEDDKFHTLKVRVKKPGLSLRYRQGYFSSSQRTSHEDAQSVLKSVVGSPLDASAIGLRVKLEKPQQKSGSLTAIVSVEAHDLAIQQQTGKNWTGHVKVAYVIQAETGAELAGLLDQVDLDLKPEVWAKVSEQGLTLRKEFKPPDKAFRLRIAIYDEADGRTGSISVPLEDGGPK